jgi:ankyrin repeat protein
LWFFGVDSAIQKGANIKKNGRKALIAVLNQYGSIPIIQLLNIKFQLQLPDFESEDLNTEEEGIRIINLLLEKGVDISLLYKKVFVEFVDRNEVIVVSQLLQTNYLNKTHKRNALVSSSKKGNLEMVKILIEGGVNTPAYLTKALMAAAYHGHLEVIKLLVANGADIIAKNGEALAFAVSCHTNNGHLEVVRYLIENDADIDISRKSHPFKWSKIRDAAIQVYLDNL